MEVDEVDDMVSRLPDSDVCLCTPGTNVGKASPKTTILSTPQVS